MAFVVTMEWWYLVIFGVFFWLAFMGAFWYGQRSARTKNRSRSHSQVEVSHPMLFDDLQPDLPPPPPTFHHEPELTPWIAYDDGTWERLCSERCNGGLVYGNKLCGTCNGLGYEVSYEDPYQSSRDMEPSSPLPPPTTSEVTHLSQVTFQWPPTDLVEP